MNRRTFALCALAAPLASRSADSAPQRTSTRLAQLGRRMVASHLGILAGIGVVVGVAALWHQVRGTGRPDKPWEHGSSSLQSRKQAPVDSGAKPTS